MRQQPASLRMLLLIGQPHENQLILLQRDGVPWPCLDWTALESQGGRNQMRLSNRRWGVGSWYKAAGRLNLSSVPNLSDLWGLLVHPGQEKKKREEKKNNKESEHKCHCLRCLIIWTLRGCCAAEGHVFSCTRAQVAAEQPSADGNSRHGCHHECPLWASPRYNWTLDFTLD